MKIVIDIPSNLKIMNEQMNVLLSCEIDEIREAIKNGTPLPKGHGKLVDVEDVKDNIRKWRGYLDEDMMGRINFAMEHHIPTIIEADKECDTDE